MNSSSSSGLLLEKLTNIHIIEAVRRSNHDPQQPMQPMSLWKIERAKLGYLELLAQKKKNYTCIGENRYMYSDTDGTVYIFTMHINLSDKIYGVYVVSGQNDPFFEYILDDE